MTRLSTDTNARQAQLWVTSFWMSYTHTCYVTIRIELKWDTITDCPPRLAVRSHQLLVSSQDRTSTGRIFILQIYLCAYDVAFPASCPLNVPRARQRWDRTLGACHHPLVLIAVRPSCVLSICPRIWPASKVAQHELKENGPERCLTLAQDENLIGPCACNRGCMTTARLRCALTSLLAEKARHGEKGQRFSQSRYRQSSPEPFAAESPNG